MPTFTKSEIKLYSSLNNPALIQNYLNSLKFQIIGDNDTCASPRTVIQNQTAQCMEGAMLASSILRFHGHKPLILDLTATDEDADHVVALFKINKCWGAISKTNHGVLRYREPIYKSIRELVMSYFHEYFLQTNRQKTLRTYSRPVNLARFDHLNWETNNQPNWFIPEYLTTVSHIPILTKTQIKNLRLADEIEVKMANIEEWPNSNGSSSVA